MSSLYDLTPEEQLELVQFARARLAEEKARQLREIELKEEILADAETLLCKLRDETPLGHAQGVRSLGDTWPAYMAYLVASPYKGHADYMPVWER